MIGLKRGKVKLSKPKAIWQQSFEKEKSKLKKVLGKDLIDIQHIGSTAISGISAKPIIDIGLIVSSLEKIRKYIPALKKIGYNLKVEDRKDRLFFTKGAESKRTHYLHIGEVSSGYVEDMILFRDYLNNNKETLKEYAELKDKLARQYPEERYIYTEKKEKFIKSIIKKAKSKLFVYRYTSNNEGVWSAGKRLLPENLVEEASENRKWLIKPNLPEDNYSFYMTEKGKEMYEKTLLKVHQKYLQNIKCEKYSFEEVSKLGEVAYEDKNQIVIKLNK